ncbi:hypothetical protein VST63_01220 [Mycolicibacterium sp. 050232]|uniref:hypothetical protein n=1 Tax=Mycolicibacterium sp. 050232 TaxID=3113982 RepID=UPI002E2DC03C|nr:hypothetical protein [Mycolicibacterium sp. 050232]MED5810966.1 hypothetical protein [Mycolicibacterium sp. 050232]
MRLLSRSEQETETAVLDEPDHVDSQLTDDGPVGEDEEQPAEAEVKRSRRPRLSTLLAGVAILVSGALIAAGGYVLWYHQQADVEQQRRAEFAAAASQAAVTLMSIDSATAQDNVRQILDNSTGQFKADIESSSEDLVKAAQDSKATTKATVGASAVQSMDGDSAVVLVSTSTTVSNSAGANQQPRNWRLSVTMVKDGGQIKMSKVEFVP